MIRQTVSIPIERVLAGIICRSYPAVATLVTADARV
jgi:hypothetical protein